VSRAAAEGRRAECVCEAESELASVLIGVDDLADQPFPHANFHLPEAVGNARAYAITKNATDRKLATTFFNALTTK